MQTPVGRQSSFESFRLSPSPKSTGHHRSFQKSLVTSVSLSPSSLGSCSSLDGGTQSTRQRAAWVPPENSAGRFGGDGIKKSPDGRRPRSPGSPSTPRFRSTWGTPQATTPVHHPSPASDLPPFSPVTSPLATPASSSPATPITTPKRPQRPQSAHPDLVRLPFREDHGAAQAVRRPKSAPPSRLRPKEVMPGDPKFLWVTTPRDKAGHLPIQPQSVASRIMFNSPQASFGSKVWRPRPSSAMYIQPGSLTCDYRWRKPDARAIHFDPKFAGNPSALARHLADGFPANVDKARAIFRWIAEHIAYDPERAKAPEPTVRVGEDGIAHPIGDQLPQEVLERRRGVCAGFAGLMKTMADAVRVPCKLIGGYGKEQISAVDSLEPTHAWNTLLVDGVWVPMDCTWAAGKVDAKGQFQRKFDPFWWLTPPERFVHTHFPSVRGDATHISGMTKLPRWEHFCEGLGLRGEFFACNLIVVDALTGRLEATPGQDIVVKLREDWKAQGNQQAASRHKGTGDDVLCGESHQDAIKPSTRGGGHAESGLRLTAHLYLLDKEGQPEENPVEGTEVLYSYDRQVRQHKVRCPIPHRNGGPTYLLRIFAHRAAQSEAQVILEFEVVDAQAYRQEQDRREKERLKQEKLEQRKRRARIEAERTRDRQAKAGK